MACERTRAEASSNAHQQRISRDPMRLLAPTSGARLKRRCCSLRAAATLMRTVALGSSEPTALSFSTGTAGTSMWRSIRSNNGPEIRPRYRATAAGSQVQRSPSAPYSPHGHPCGQQSHLYRTRSRGLRTHEEGRPQSRIEGRTPHLGQIWATSGLQSLAQGGPFTDNIRIYAGFARIRGPVMRANTDPIRNSTYPVPYPPPSAAWSW
jgi:hypothetical protein